MSLLPNIKILYSLLQVGLAFRILPFIRKFNICHRVNINLLMRQTFVGEQVRWSPSHLPWVPNPGLGGLNHFDYQMSFVVTAQLNLNLNHNWSWSETLKWVGSHHPTTTPPTPPPPHRNF
jgi:hypothetical protein